jgi:dTDP-glucose 4,6-dehydratase
MIRNLQQGKALLVYGDGKNIRDWLYVEDHNQAVWQIMQSGRSGETYNIGGENEWENITLVRQLCKIKAKVTGKPEEKYLDLMFIRNSTGVSP